MSATARIPNSQSIKFDEVVVEEEQKNPTLENLQRKKSNKVKDHKRVSSTSTIIDCSNMESSEISEVAEIATRSKRHKKKSSDHLSQRITGFFGSMRGMTLRKNKASNLKKGTARFGDTDSS